MKLEQDESGHSSEKLLGKELSAYPAVLNLHPIAISQAEQSQQSMESGQEEYLKQAKTPQD